MRAWTFVPRNVPHIVQRDRYYLLYSREIVRDREHKVDKVFAKFNCHAHSIFPQAAKDSVIRPVPILLNLSDGKPIGIEDFYSSVPYILDVMNVNLGTTDLVELDVSFDDMFDIYDVKDEHFLNKVDSNILADKSIEMHPIISALPYIEVDKIIGLYNVNQWGDVLLFEDHTLSFRGNPFCGESLYVSVTGEPKRKKVLKFYPMSRYEVFQQRLNKGARRILDDTSIYNALHVVSRKQAEIINARVRKLGIHPDDWIYTTLADIKKKEESSK